jgi:three-Cys-motif partner protein
MTLWPLTPHTRAKHQILKHYLGAWFPKLAWTGRVLMVDGFAGPGEYSGGEPGSPQVALDVARTHTGRLERCELLFIFIEADRQRFAHLSRVVRAIELPPHMKAQAIHGTFDATMTEVLDQIDAASANLAPALVMVDPFGAKGMPLETLKRIAAQARSELLVSLMYDPISRWSKTEEFEPHLDMLYGTPSWRDVELQGTAEERRQFMLGLYVRQLRSVVGMQHVSVFELRDSGNRVEYFLLHATHSMDGLKAMKEAMWKVDPEGGLRFSDATAGRGQATFQLEPDFGLLKREIVAKFKARTGVQVGEIERFVLIETAFRETHFKRQVLRPMELGGEIEVHGPSGRRRGTFPDGVTVDFP